MKRHLLILAAALIASGCSLHLSAELLNPLNKGGQAAQTKKPKPIEISPTPRPWVSPTPFPRPWGGQ